MMVLMRTLYLLRHAKSSWSERSLADYERPLAARGRRDAKRIAQHLVREGVEPELVICSTAVRTRETLDRVRRAFGAGVTVELDDELYGASSPGLLERLHAVPDDVASVMLIGHNPGLEDLALALASSGDRLSELEAKFPTAALATLEVPTAAWRELAAGDAVLAAFVVPRELAA
jgi:phosphohistidine phosphatase